MRTYVILDPQHEYGVALVEAIRRHHHLDPIVVYTSCKDALFKRSTYPELETSVVAHYGLDQMSMAAIAADIRRQGHQVLAVVPYFEQGIEPMAELMRRLELDWNTPATLALFRDKLALKAHIKAHSQVPVGLARQVCSPQEVFAGELPDAYVIKPNGGFANRAIGFFDRASGREEIEAYFGANPGACVLEELFVGTEYAVNGQMDHRGDAIVVNVTRYERVAGNGKPNLYHRTHHVPRGDPAYSQAADYAVAAMRATGLRRCPFHMELMLTAAGPRLIEVAARFGGTRYAFMSNDVHGGSLDVFSLAAHYYLFDRDFGPAPFNWPHYDQIHYLHLDGISHQDGRIYSLAGRAAVEALPEFVCWVVRPQVGGRLYRTLDLYQVPYSLHLMSLASDAAVREASEEAKRLLVFNRQSSMARRLWVTALRQLGSVRFRGAWLAHRLRPHIRRRRLGQ